MKLLRVISTIDPKTGGPIEGLKRASEVMDRLGVEVEVASADSAEDARGYPDFKWKLHPMGPAKGGYGYAKRLATWLNEKVGDYDAVIIHGLWQHHGLAASRACRRNRVPYYVFTHGMLDPWFNRAYPLKMVKKIPYWLLFEHGVLKHANQVLFTAEQERVLAAQSFRPYAVNEFVCGYGTTPPPQSAEELKAHFTAAPPAWHSRPFLLFLGRIHEKKGVDLLVQAYSELRSRNPEVPDLVFAGPIQQEDLHATLVERWPQDGIHWVGKLAGEAKYQALATAEAMILPSHQENFGLVVAEALSVGTPVLITKPVNIWKEIAAGNAGYVEDDTLDGTRRLLERWMACPPEARAQMGTAALEVFQHNFNIGNATKRLVDLIAGETAASGQGSASPRTDSVIP